MKGLHRFIDTKIKPMFEPKEGKKKGVLYWLYDGLETFLFTPGHTTQGGAHIRDGIDLKRTMMTVIIALVPCLLFGIYNTGHWYYIGNGLVDADAAWDAMFWDKVWYGAKIVLPIVIVSYGVGLGIEFLFCAVRGHGIHEGFLVSGMLIPLIMPADVPLWMVAVGTAFAVLIGKEIFGGTGMNILNVALTARAFLFFSYPNSMIGNKVWIPVKDGADKLVDGMSGSTALGDLASVTTNEPAFPKEGFLKSFSEVYSFEDSMIGLIPGSIGETSAIACLIGAVLLIYTGIGSLRIMLSFLAGGLGMALIFNAMGSNPYMELDPFHQLALGGFMFGMVFMATDPVTAAQTPTGKIIYGLIAGSFAMLIRVSNSAYPEGVMLAILFANVMAPTIDHMVVSQNIKRRAKRVKVA